MIYQDESQMIFADWMVSSLDTFGVPLWQNFFEQVSESPSDSLERKAFVLMIAKLDSCETCNADSFRALRGCVRCVEQNISRMREKPQELLDLFEKAMEEIKKKG